MNTETFSFDVFLSHSPIDLRPVREIATRLKRAGLRVWLKDPQQENYSASTDTDEVLRTSRKLVICLSLDAISSGWADFDAQTRMVRPEQILVVRLDEFTITKQFLDFKVFEWRNGGRQKDFLKLLKACKDYKEASHNTHPSPLPFTSDFISDTSPTLILPPTPFERRMRRLGKYFATPPENSRAGKRLNKIMASDFGFQMQLKEMARQLPCIVYSRMRSGSGLQMAKLLRSYFLEYFDRSVSWLNGKWGIARALRRKFTESLSPSG